ncbi:MAG: hypothetical protein HS108_14215 [Planctomycetes bacterium]|nr:hypothetical protein [Planctomycetota bacterium]MCL4730951.1 hypothetical protein [Planctomycetota bacterium]
MERDIFPADEVYSQLEKEFVLVAQYTDDPNNALPAQNLIRYAGDGVAVPLYIVTDTKGKEIARLTPPTNIARLSTREFADFLRGARQKFAAGG